MGRAPCCDKANVKRGPWSPEEDAQLKDYIHRHGTGGNWIALPQKAGLKRCGKSCRLRWLNYLRPNIKHGEFSEEEDMLICSLFSSIGSRWSIIAAQLPGRTDNDIKNYWNTKLKKKLMAISNFNTHKPQLSSPHKFKTNLFMLPRNSSPSQSPFIMSPAMSSNSPYNNNNNNNNSSGSNYYNAPTSSTFPYTGFDQSTLLGISSNSLSTSPAAASTILQTPQLLQPGHHLSSSPNPTHSSYLVFAGAPEPSCSSSDGTNSGKQGISLQNCGYFYNVSPSLEEDDQKIDIGRFSSSDLLGSEKAQINSDSLIWEETAPLMDYGLEEIKQLISSSTANSFYSDENQTEEKTVLYY